MPLLPATVLWRNDPRRGRIVVACCRQAAVLGIRFAMPVVEAVELIQAEPSQASSAIVAQHDEMLDLASLEKVAELVQANISPLVAIETLDRYPWAGQPLGQPDSLLCDLSGVSHLFGGETELLQATDRLLQKHQLEARLAIADTAAGAWALAHYHADRRADHDSPMQPGVISSANRRTESPRFIIAPLNDMSRWIDPLPVEALRLDLATVTTLHRLGVQTIASLRRLPRAGLAMRLGDQLITRLSQAIGEVDEPLAFHRPQPDHVHTIELEYPTDDHMILQAQLARLAVQTCQQLGLSQQGVLRLECRLQPVSHPVDRFELGLFAPTQDARHLTRLLASAFERRRLASPVCRLSLAVTLTGPLQCVQTAMFVNLSDHPEGFSAAGNPTQLVARLVDSLSGRLGRDAVLGIELADDPLPENAFCSFPLTGRSRPRQRTSSKQATKHQRPANQREPSETDCAAVSGQRFATPSPADALRRPLTLLSAPALLAVIGPGSAAGDQPPQRFRLAGKVYRIVQYWGPERIETGWWRGPSIGRDYFRLQTDQGECWWVFRNLVPPAQRPADAQRHDWMLHGRFA